MTIEEKTKAYDDALWQAKKELKTCGSLDCDAARQIFRLFPQLRESEDERIRRNLVEAFIEYKKSGGTDFHGIEIDYLLAWLEKQKVFAEHGYGLYYYHNGGFTFVARPAEEKDEENPYDFAMSQQEKQKPKFGDRDLPQLARVKADGHIVNIHNGQLSNDAKKWIMYGSDEKDGYKSYLPEELEFLSDERPADLSTMMIHKEPHIAQAPTPMVADVQKPAEWSEEDEKRIKQLIYDTEAIRAGYEKKKEQLGDRFNDALIKDCDEQIRWLKSLRPQPKREMTDEDKKILDSVSQVLIGLNYQELAKDYKQAVEKLLYSRPSWKPSEEQMDSLRDTIVQTKGYSYSMYLPELYEQLKKL